MALDLLDFEPTQEAIELLLDNICKIFGGNTEQTCDDFINKNIEKLVDSLINKYNTDFACNYMGACIE